jgi:hypothetical protein
LIGCGSLDGGEESRSGPCLVLLGTGWDGMDGGEAEGEEDSECLHLLPNLWVFCKH